jgi:hypothetical protein
MPTRRRHGIGVVRVGAETLSELRWTDSRLQLCRRRARRDDAARVSSIRSDGSTPAIKVASGTGCR